MLERRTVNSCKSGRVLKTAIGGAAAGITDLRRTLGAPAAPYGHGGVGFSRWQTGFSQACARHQNSRAQRLYPLAYHAHPRARKPARALGKPADERYRCHKRWGAAARVLSCTCRDGSSA